MNLINFSCVIFFVAECPNTPKSYTTFICKLIFCYLTVFKCSELYAGLSLCYADKNDFKKVEGGERIDSVLYFFFIKVMQGFCQILFFENPKNRHKFAVVLWRTSHTYIISWIACWKCEKKQKSFDSGTSSHSFLWVGDENDL